MPGRKRDRISLCALVFLVALGFPPGLLHGDTTPMPFHPGEQLKFEVYWTVIPAGEATLEVLPLETLSGVSCYRFGLTARTYEPIDVFYKIRDRIDAYTDRAMSRSLLFRKVQEGKSRRNITVHYDWEKGEARYTNFEERREPVPLLPGTLDPLSVFYAFRTLPLEEGKEMELPVSDGKRCVMGKARVIRRERIEVASGSYDTFLVEPEMKHIGGVFEKSPKANLLVWVTADEHRIPVKIKSRVRVGSFVAELTAWKRGTPAEGEEKPSPGAP